ncbi:MAG: hypothetical protein QM811_15895 [Pirellulales bacterium]
METVWLILILAVANALGLVFSMLVIGRLFGIEFGVFGEAFLKCFGLMLATILVSFFLPGLSLVLNPLIWVGGLMLLFEMEFFEVAVFTVANWILSAIINVAVLAMWATF